MEKKIEMVHFQITRNCNLRCHFCGQWGKKGFFSDASGSSMEFDDWINVIEQLKKYRDENKTEVDITVWGGEPLVSPCFDELIKYLDANDFKIAIVTNGVFIDKHKDVIRNCVNKIYLSIDGTKEIHDQIRGNGVFDKVALNVKELNHPNITVMSVITEKLIENLNEYFDVLNSLNIKELYLQDMIGLTKEEIQSYKKWLKQSFDIDAVDIISWENDTKFDFGDKVDELINKLDLNKFNYKIIHKSHANQNKKHCLSPFKHIHIAWNGNVLYCTDFYDFSAGNVKNDDLIDIFNNEISQKFRTEVSNKNCVTCNHCSWNDNESFYL